MAHDQSTPSVSTASSVTTDTAKLAAARWVGLMARLLERWTRLRRRAPVDCTWCGCPTAEIIHHIALCRSCNAEWPEMQRRLFGWWRN